MPELGLFGLYMVVFLFSLSLHEMAHAWTAERFGDPTARYQGRVTLNPLPHIDVFGTLIFPAIGFFTGGIMFGWAKPVQWNPLHVKDRRKADIWISAAGPISNVLALFGFAIIFKLFRAYAAGGGNIDSDVMQPLIAMSVMGIKLNVILAVFNMLPIPPLDGSYILPYFLPTGMASTYEQLRPYGFIILIGCLYLGVLEYVLAPFWGVVQFILLS
ncbi:MAG: site-2 protease family protein [Acidobacteriota bacterium]